MNFELDSDFLPTNNNKWNEKEKKTMKAPLREIQIRYRKYVYATNLKGKQVLVRVRKNARTMSLDATF